MDINELVSLIGNVGFPVAVSSYLLIRLEKELRSLSSSIIKLSALISAKLGTSVEVNEKI